MLEEAEAAVEAVRAGSFARTLQEALANLAFLEERFARAHAELIARAGHPGLRELFRKLAEQDWGHEELLKKR